MKEQKMKFNWRANWEILLVLVIIIIGIVITTIAAIRSKDKHHQLLVLPDDASDYGGLAEPAVSSQHQVPQLPQTDFQLQGSRESLAPDEGGGAYAATSSPFAAITSTLASSRRPAKPQPSSQPGNHHHHHSVFPANARKLAHAKQQNQARASASLDANSLAPTAAYAHTPHVSHSGSTGGALQMGSAPAQDNYDALSTESTPSQVSRLNEPARSTKSLDTSRRNVAQRHKSSQLDATDVANDQPEVLDDFHTTRSALATQPHFPNFPANQMANSAGRLDELAPSPSPPPPTMQGPYELLPSLAHNHDSQIGMQNRLVQQPNKSDNQQAPPATPMLEPEDMMTSYSRLPRTNLTDALMRDYNMAIAGTNDSSRIDQAQLLGGNQGRHRSNTMSLPFSVLLADIIRLTRPSSLINTQAPLEQPANSRPQYSILQQLRSLPGPLIALLQGSPSRSGNSGQASSEANFGGQPPSHDASESSQHYQSISMSPSDMNMILSRSLRATGALPAFPPPKGTPQTWIPPNAGGTPINDAVSSNADFVSSNTAGFLRDVNSSSNSQASSQAASQESSQTNASSQQHQSVDQNQVAYKQQPPPQSAELQQRQYQRQQQSSGGVNYPLLDETPNGNEQQLQQPQTSANMKNAQAQTLFQQQGAGYRLFRQASNQQTQQAFQNSQIQSNMMQSQPQAMGANTQNNMQFQMGKAAGQMAPPASLYRPRQTTSELFESIQNNAPLGYNLQQQQQLAASLAAQSALINQNDFLQQQQQLLMAPNGQSSYDFSAMSIESAPRASITSATSAQGGKSLLLSRAAVDQSKRPVSGGAPQGAQPIQLNAINRQRRAISESDLSRRQDDGPEALDDDEEEEYLDSRPMSIVSPDGRPMSGERVKILRHRKHQELGEDPVTPVSSSREVKHQDLDESAMHHYASQSSAAAATSAGAADRGSAKASKRRNKQEQARKSVAGQRQIVQEELKKHGKKSHKKGLKQSKEDVDERRRAITNYAGAEKHMAQKGASRRQKINANLATAGSGLMSKLLGTASSNDDEVDDDLDGDDDEGSSANERRKEEQNDAEFAIGNDERNAAPTPGDANSLAGAVTGSVDEVSRLSEHDALGAGQSDGSTGSGESDSSMSSGSAGSNSYTRRNQQQQRPDVEFYGHPGEETRQLKYGILGSGNYEVVNGGIYPDADESTAAVNSVANYVRKPAGVLMGGLPKLLADAAASEAGGEQAAQGYMPGGRMSALSGFMRGASARPDELVGMFSPPLAASAGKPGHLGNPLLELIEANSGHLIDPNLVAQLGSSGTSARTTFASKESAEDEEAAHEAAPPRSHRKSLSGNEMADERRPSKQRAGFKDSSGRKRTKPGEDAYEIEQSQHQHASSALRRSKSQHADAEREADKHRDPLTGSKGQGTNQFYSYQILPSKKVTIFSDQDLDSAPSEQASTIARLQT